MLQLGGSDYEKVTKMIPKLVQGGPKIHHKSTKTCLSKGTGSASMTVGLPIELPTIAYDSEYVGCAGCRRYNGFIIYILRATPSAAGPL